MVQKQGLILLQSLGEEISSSPFVCVPAGHGVQLLALMAALKVFGGHGSQEPVAVICCPGGQSGTEMKKV